MKRGVKEGDGDLKKKMSPRKPASRARVCADVLASRELLRIGDTLPVEMRLR